MMKVIGGLEETGTDVSGYTDGETLLKVDIFELISYTKNTKSKNILMAQLADNRVFEVD